MKRIISIVAAISVFAIFSSSFILGEESSPKKMNHQMYLLIKKMPI